MAHSARSWSRLSPCEWRASCLSILHRPNRFPISALHRGRVECPRGARWLEQSDVRTGACDFIHPTAQAKRLWWA